MQFDLKSANRYHFGLCGFSSQSISWLPDVSLGHHCPQQQSLHQPTPSDSCSLQWHSFLDSPAWGLYTCPQDWWLSLEPDINWLLNSGNFLLVLFRRWHESSSWMGFWSIKDYFCSSYMSYCVTGVSCPITKLLAFIKSYTSNSLYTPGSPWSLVHC